MQKLMNSREKDLLHLVDTITLTADPCDMCQWCKQMNNECMTTCTVVKDLCTLKYKFFIQWPEEMMTHAENLTYCSIVTPLTNMQICSTLFSM